MYSGARTTGEGHEGAHEEGALVRYMASLVTLSTPDPSVLPEEAKRFGELTERGVVTDFYVAHDRRKGWMVVNAGSPEAAREAVESLPLARYWEIEITQLSGA